MKVERAALIFRQHCKKEMTSHNCNRYRNALALFLILGFAFSEAWANPSLPYLISDHAVFQQGRRIRIWGTSDAGEQITVGLAQNKAGTHADHAGRWSVDLPAMQAGGPFSLTVVGNATVVIKDVLIGEVWVASGQSNMTFALADSAGAAEELPRADYAEIRLFMVPKRLSQSPSLTLSAPYGLLARPHPQRTSRLLRITLRVNCTAISTCPSELLKARGPEPRSKNGWRPRRFSWTHKSNQR